MLAKIHWRGDFPLIAALLAMQMPIDGELTTAAEDAIGGGRDSMLAEAASVGGDSVKLLFWLTLYAVSTLYVVFRKPVSSKHILWGNLPFVLLVMMVPLSLLWTENVAQVATHSAHNIGILAIALAAIIVHRDNPTALVRIMALALGANLLVHVLGVILAPSYAIDLNGRWRGLSSHPNQIGAIAFITLVLNAACLMSEYAYRKWIHLIAIFLAIAVFVGTQSKTSTMCGTIAVLGVISLGKIYKTYGERGALQFMLAFSIAAIALSVPIFLLFEQIIGSFTGAIGRDPTFTGRTTVWEYAIESIKAKPVLGWSFDSHLTVLSGTPLRYNDFHNGYLDIAVSGGLVALGLFCMAVARFLGAISVSNKTITVIYLPILLSIVIYNIFEAEFLGGRSEIWLLLIICILSQSALMHRNRSDLTKPA